MFGFGMPELIVIGVVVLLIFGPGKLPQIGSALGGAIKSFRSAADDDGKVVKGGEQEQKKEA